MHSLHGEMGWRRDGVGGREGQRQGGSGIEGAVVKLTDAMDSARSRLVVMGRERGWQARGGGKHQEVLLGKLANVSDKSRTCFITGEGRTGQGKLSPPIFTLSHVFRR